MYYLDVPPALAVLSVVCLLMAINILLALVLTGRPRVLHIALMILVVLLAMAMALVLTYAKRSTLSKTPFYSVEMSKR